jgi:hypothetical protein
MSATASGKPTAQIPPDERIIHLLTKRQHTKPVPERSSLTDARSRLATVPGDAKEVREDADAA